MSSSQSKVLADREETFVTERFHDFFQSIIQNHQPTDVQAGYLNRKRKSILNPLQKLIFVPSGVLKNFIHIHINVLG